MTIHGNGGTLTTNHKVHVHNYGDIWFHEKAITNILSLKNVSHHFCVTYDSADSTTFSVKKPDGTILHFMMHDNSLHYHDMNNQQFTLVQTISSNMEGFSRWQVDAAHHAYELQSILGHPSTKDLKGILSSRQIDNCPVIVEDVNRAEKIYGLSIPILKGKMT